MLLDQIDYFGSLTRAGNDTPQGRDLAGLQSQERPPWPSQPVFRSGRNLLVMTQTGASRYFHHTHRPRSFQWIESQNRACPYPSAHFSPIPSAASPRIAARRLYSSAREADPRLRRNRKAEPGAIASTSDFGSPAWAFHPPIATNRLCQSANS